MQGVTTTLVAFLFVCVVFPNLVKNRPQYYAALWMICLIILLDALAHMLHQKPAFGVFVYVAVAFLQVAAILLLFLSAGGITWRQLANDMKRAYEVIRRGGEEKEIIIPITGEMPRQREQPPPPPRITIEDSSSVPNVQPSSGEQAQSDMPPRPPVQS